jgi:hypothetical protein
MHDYQPLHCYKHFNISRFCMILYTDCIRGNDEIIRKVTNSLLRGAELCIQKVGGHFQQQLE